MKFLSDEWFSKVDELREAAGDLEVPEAMAGLVINITIEREGADSVEAHLDAGNFKRSHNDAGEVVLTLGDELCRKIFVEGDTAAGMQAFMAGEIKIDGDMTKLMALQTTPLSDKQKALLVQVKEITE